MTAPAPSSPYTLRAFVTESASLAAARELAASHNWPAECVQEGDIAAASAYLGKHPTPDFLLVEIASAAEASAALNKLADVCAPEVRVIVTSKINEFSFYAMLKEMGVHEYLLQPFTAQALESLLKKTDEKPEAQDKKEESGGVTAFMGTRGGVGTTTIVTNLAYILSKEYQKKTALLDIDAHFGTAAMSFDLEPSRGLHNLFDHPERIDGLFLDRVMVTHSETLSLLSAEEPLRDTMMAKALAAEVLLARAREKFSHVLVDTPRNLTPLVRTTLAQADKVVLIAELTLLSLRDLMRLRDYVKDDLGRPEPIVVANREGYASRHEINKAEFEKHYGHPVHVHIPCMMEAFASAASGEMLVQTTKNSAGLQALHLLADEILGEKHETKQTGILGKWRKGRA